MGQEGLRSSARMPLDRSTNWDWQLSGKIEWTGTPYEKETSHNLDERLENDGR